MGHVSIIKKVLCVVFRTIFYMIVIYKFNFIDLRNYNNVVTIKRKHIQKKNLCLRIIPLSPLFRHIIPLSHYFGISYHYPHYFGISYHYPHYFGISYHYPHYFSISYHYPHYFGISCHYPHYFVTKNIRR